MRGFLMSARAMAMRCFCPPDSWMPPSPSCAARIHAHVVARQTHRSSYTVAC